MLASLYSALTRYEGIYLLYFSPIAYALSLFARLLNSKRQQRHAIGVGDILTAIALGLITLDFGYYLYLFLTHTGKLLPAPALFLKYSGGLLLWLWVGRYSYQEYFAARIAGKQFKTWFTPLIRIIIGALSLALIGISLS